MTKARRIKTNLDNGIKLMSISGWLHGKYSYLWFGEVNEVRCLGTLKQIFTIFCQLSEMKVIAIPPKE